MMVPGGATHRVVMVTFKAHLYNHLLSRGLKRDKVEQVQPPGLN